MVEMNVRQIASASELSRLRGSGGYVLNIVRRRACIHRASCVTVTWMNPDKKGGVYYSATLAEALKWLEAEAVRGAPCRLCLSTLAYRPRPEKLTAHLNQPGD